uniref:Glycosyltransferase family 92 protein n=1 Tax=Globodera rostochiensis TaxID=31243 RepID=A0A914H6N3_GLORO
MDDMECMVVKNGIIVKRMASKKEYIQSLHLCSLELYILTCTLDGLQKDSVLLEDAAQRNMYSLILPETNRRHRHSVKITLNPIRPSYQERGLVLCMSRVLLYEKWQLLITGLEAYRLFKVDLVVTHVQSALLSIFELLKAYEQLGFLKIMPGIRLPHQRGMRWDPNAETEFNGQILLAHECFYEYRESAQFIGLIDWDDLLVPSKHFSTLPAAFAAAFTQNPDTAYFLVNKLEASFVEQRVKYPAEFSLRKLLKDGIRTAEMYNDEKMVVRPKALRGFWMHNSQNVEPNKRAVKVFTNYSIILHLANEERANPDEFQTPFMTKFNISKMDLHASEQLKKLNNSKLPSSQPFYNALVKCHSQIFAYYKDVGPERSGCLSYSLCVLPRLPEAICAVTKSKFDTVLTRSGAVFHARKYSEFGHERCIKEGGI